MNEKIPFVKGTIPLNLEQIKDLKESAMLNNRMEAYADVLLQWAEGAMTELVRLKQIKTCNHEIVDGRNEVIVSGYMCTKCNAVFAAGDHD